MHEYKLSAQKNDKRPTRFSVLKMWGLLTAQWRLFPDFLIIGAQKSGTSSLYRYIVAHSNVFPALRKEVHFFDRNYSKGTSWYRAHFPTTIHKDYIERIKGQKHITGEASPYYIFHPLSPQRVASIIPQVKLIAILRHPVDRAYSQYNHAVRLGSELRSFEDALEAELKYIEQYTEQLKLDKAGMNDDHQRYSYISRGIYVNQLNEWLSLFPRTQLLVLSYEEMCQEPAKVTAQVFSFLNLPPRIEKEYQRYGAQQYEPMKIETRKKLLAIYKPFNDSLNDLLKMQLNWDS